VKLVRGDAVRTIQPCFVDRDLMPTTSMRLCDRVATR
jgi:hypothetical protein